MQPRSCSTLVAILGPPCSQVAGVRVPGPRMRVLTCCLAFTLFLAWSSGLPAAEKDNQVADNAGQGKYKDKDKGQAGNKKKEKKISKKGDAKKGREEKKKAGSNARSRNKEKEGKPNGVKKKSKKETKGKGGGKKAGKLPNQRNLERETTVSLKL